VKKKQKKRMPKFLYPIKDLYSFQIRRMVGGGYVPFYLKFWEQTDPVGANADF